jgi:hypothetical protein
MCSEELFNEMCEYHNVTTAEKNRIEYLFADDAAEALENLLQGEDDFEVGNYRVIKESAIDQIMANELSDDPYILGCFNADFLANILEIPQRIIEICQNAEAQQELGEMLTTEQIEKLAREYAAADGYGHHFAHYDHQTEELVFDNDLYYVFRTH